LARKTDRKSAPRGKREILIFGEDENDRAALRELFRALRPDLDAVAIRALREPLILMRDPSRLATRKHNAKTVAAVVKARQVAAGVVAVIAHQDCDAVEPAHKPLAERIETELSSAGVPNPIAATPAWEMETWWLLFPDALAATRQCWSRIDYANRNVGLIEDTKKKLRDALRPRGRAARASCPDYAESDSVAIARHVRRLALHGKPVATSDSWVAFVNKARALKIAG
jgi:hypothetical protein